MKLSEAQEMVGIDIAVIDRMKHWHARVGDLKEGKNGSKAKLVAVGKYRIANVGWCGNTSYEAVDYGRNVGVAELQREVREGNKMVTRTVYLEVPLGSLISWTTYSRIAEENRMVQAEFDTMRKASIALNRELAAERLAVIARMPRHEREAMANDISMVTRWSRDGVTSEPVVVASFRWDPARDTKRTRDLADRLDEITRRMECKR